MSDYVPNSSHLSITPLGAGDLIDRAVRFYRKNFWVFILIASPPIVIGTIVLVGWSALGRYLFTVNSTNSGEAALYQVFVAFGNLVIWGIQSIATLVVMGGASRNFVRHILFDEPITFRETYKNAASRLPGLIAASTIITIILSLSGLIILYSGLTIVAIAVMVIALALNKVPLLAFIFGGAVGASGSLATLWVFFLVVSRFVYVPQIMLVEGRSVISAIGRSTTLAGKNVRRVGALFIFTLAATYSALLLLLVPLGWYAWISGVNLGDLFRADTIPAWYQIANQVVSQISFILLTPIWMIGLCLLYVDERVRREGYDIELMAAKRLGDIPSVPDAYINPLQPALSKKPLSEARAASQISSKLKDNSILGLE